MRIAVIGLGLIGGSVLRAFARAGCDVSGFDADPRVRDAVAEAGFEVTDRDGCAAADVLVLAIPAPHLPSLLPSLSDFPGIVTDVTSVKTPVADAMKRYCPAVRYVGGHPMAGKEVSGFAASDASLFDGRAWALCLGEEVSRAQELDDWVTLADLLCRMGVRVVPTTAARHDDAVARISHLPHLLAAALTRTAAEPQALTLAAGSFSDGTRVAASDPYLVSAMCSANAEALHDALDDCLAMLDEARRKLTASRQDLAEWLTPASTARRAWPPRAGTSHTDAVTRDKILHIGVVGGWVESVHDGRAEILWRVPGDSLP